MKCALLLAGAVATINGDPSLKESLDHNFRGGYLRETTVTLYGRGAADAVRGDTTGLRIRLQSARDAVAPVGIASKLAIHGDFEITIAYDLLHVAKPAAGYGAGLNVRLVAATVAADYATISRIQHPKHGSVYATDRGYYTDDQATQSLRYIFTTAKQGRLRLIRTGTVLTYQAADGEGPDFAVLRGDQPFVNAAIKVLRVTASTGNSAGSVEVRLKSLRIRCSRLAASADEATPQTGWVYLWAIGTPAIVIIIIISVKAYRSPTRPSHLTGKRDCI